MDQHGLSSNGEYAEQQISIIGELWAATTSAIMRPGPRRAAGALDLLGNAQRSDDTGRWLPRRPPPHLRS
ncbi:hypothetical protein AB0B57_02885 [Micromonospora sp. NPDC049101]|uniref:hypothetical protein n=1 Tax=Micromonospora sp. NPDC049101 TaxID=3155032 RepID=UPI003404FC56